MKAYCFFSVHEEMFHRVAQRLRNYGVTEFSGFLWGNHQARTIQGGAIAYDPLVVFTRDLLPKANDGRPPDLAWLERREQELGISIQRMLASERHLLQGRSFEQILRMAEVALREIAATYDRVKPDFVFSESVACFHSYVHFVLARERRIPFWCIGTGRLRGRIAVYSSASQRWERVEMLYRDYCKAGIPDTARAEAEAYIIGLRERQVSERSAEVRSKTRIDRAEIARFAASLAHYFGDRKDPTATPPWEAITHRLRRVARVRMTEARNLFERPVAGEKYVLYPIHFQPEASTLVQAPMYLDQLALLEDVAKCLPVGARLYVKEHVVNTGRRAVEFYEAIRAIPGARLLGPHEDVWPLIEQASAIAVITGTMGWEALMFGKPVITFGDVYFNLLPQVYRAGSAPKDAWYDLFARALREHRDDHDALVALVAAMQRTSFPGSMASALRAPWVLADENVDNVTIALASSAGLSRANVAA